MKFYLYILILLTVSLSCCKSLPKIEEPGFAGENFNIPVLRGKYRLTHSIKAELPNGDNFLAIGITVVDTEEKNLDAAIITVEGLVILEVSCKDNNVVINRGMPPLDSPVFAGGFVDDIKLIFFVPDCSNIEDGRSGDKFVKRYRCGDDATIDIIANTDGTENIYKYNSNNRQTRAINISSINSEGVPGKIELIAPGFFGYSLYMELIDFDRI